MSYARHITYAMGHDAIEGFKYSDGYLSIVKNVRCEDEDHALNLCEAWADTYGAVHILSLH